MKVFHFSSKDFLLFGFISQDLIMCRFFKSDLFTSDTDVCSPFFLIYNIFGTDNNNVFNVVALFFTKDLKTSI